MSQTDEKQNLTQYQEPYLSSSITRSAICSVAKETAGMSTHEACARVFRKTVGEMTKPVGTECVWAEAGSIAAPSDWNWGHGMLSAGSKVIVTINNSGALSE